MQISLIEKSLNKYLNDFIRDLKIIFQTLDNKEYKLDSNLTRITSFTNLMDFSSRDFKSTIGILDAISRIGHLPVDQISETARERYGKNVLAFIARELGITKENENEIINQVKLMYQSRLIMILLAVRKPYFTQPSYNIFLSHSSIDSREILGIKLLLLYEYGKTAYVDWLDDFQMNYLRSTEKIITLLNELLSEEERKLISDIEENFKNEKFLEIFSESDITKRILNALDRSDYFFYIDSKNSRYSKWMPFELGYAEAKLGKPIYRIIIKYKKNRKGALKYSSFLSKYKILNTLEEIK